MSDSIVLVIALTVFLAVIVFLKINDRIIYQFVNKQGRKLLATRFVGFDPSKYYSKNDLAYKIWYLDQEMNKHEARVQISLLVGVYFIEDKITQYANSLDSNSEDKP